MEQMFHEIVKCFHTGFKISILWGAKSSSIFRLYDFVELLFHVWQVRSLKMFHKISQYINVANLWNICSISHSTTFVYLLSYCMKNENFQNWKFTVWSMMNQDELKLESYVHFFWGNEQKKKSLKRTSTSIVLIFLFKTLSVTFLLILVCVYLYFSPISLKDLYSRNCCL